MVSCPKCLKDKGKLMKCVACPVKPRCFDCYEPIRVEGSLNFCDHCDLLEWFCKCGKRLDQLRPFVWIDDKNYWVKKVCRKCYWENEGRVL